MARPLRIIPPGCVVHVLNRAAHRRTIFVEPEDYLEFIRILAWAAVQVGMRLVAFCVMPNHWHLVVWPRREGDVSRFMALLTATHARAWRARHGTQGTGRVYQDRYRSVLVQDDAHVLVACRYVERNALRAGLVERAEDWMWGSLWQRSRSDAVDDYPQLSRPPVDLPSDWVDVVNRPQTTAELEAVRSCIVRQSPLGTESWRRQVGWSPPRPRGRPRRERPAGTNGV